MDELNKHTRSAVHTGPVRRGDAGGTALPRHGALPERGLGALRGPSDFRAPHRPAAPVAYRWRCARRAEALGRTPTANRTTRGALAAES